MNFLAIISVGAMLGQPVDCTINTIIVRDAITWGSDYGDHLAYYFTSPTVKVNTDKPFRDPFAALGYVAVMNLFNECEQHRYRLSARQEAEIMQAGHKFAAASVGIYNVCEKYDMEIKDVVASMMGGCAAFYEEGKFLLGGYDDD